MKKVVSSEFKGKGLFEITYIKTLKGIEINPDSSNILSKAINFVFYVACHLVINLEPLPTIESPPNYAQKTFTEIDF